MLQRAGRGEWRPMVADVVIEEDQYLGTTYIEELHSVLRETRIGSHRSRELQRNLSKWGKDSLTIRNFKI